MKLIAEQRLTLGKRVKALRRNGITPAHLFGHGIASEALQVRTEELQHVLRSTGRNDLIELDVNGEGEGGRSTSVLIRGIQRDPLTARILHVDLYQVRMTEPIEVAVPVELVGIAPAVAIKAGTLLRGVATIQVRGLPNELPSVVEVDVSGLAEAHQAIRAEELSLPAGVTLVSDPMQVVANILPIRGKDVAELGKEAAEKTAEAEETAEATAARETTPGRKSPS